MIDLCVGAHTYGGGAAHTGVKCTVHILCLYGDTVHLFRLSALACLTSTGWGWVGILQGGRVQGHPTPQARGKN